MKKRILVIFTLIAVVFYSVSALAYTPKSTYGTYPTHSTKEYYCYLSGTTDYAYAEMTYSYESTAIGFSVTGTILSSSGTITYQWLFDGAGFSSVSNSRQMELQYTPGTILSKITGSFNVGNHNVATLVVQ